MSQKKKVNDLAKEVGITGKELLEKLRSWSLGFDIKSPMASLEEYQELQIRGMMQARGLLKDKEKDSATVGDVTAAAADDLSGGLILKKKKKKKLESDESGGGDTTAAPEPHVEPTHEVTEHEHTHAPAVEPIEPAPTQARHATSEPEVEAVEAPAADESSVERTIEIPRPTEHARPSRTSAPIEESVTAQPAAASDTSAPSATPHAPATMGQAPAAPASPTAPGSPTDAGGSSPAKPLRLGKVVGFIDLSKLKSNLPAKKATESRRLRSRDDVAPDVRPTQGTDKKRTLVRGDRGPRGQLTATELRDREAGRFLRRNAMGGGPGGGGPGGGRGRGAPRHVGPASPFSGKEVHVEAPVTMKRLADALSVKTGQLLHISIQHLGFAPGSVNINSVLDEDTAVLMAQEFGVELKLDHEIAAEQALIAEIRKKRTGIEADQLLRRPPTVAFLGHVDHGKTTLIDTIRDSRVAQGEAGGITQHIGAYQVKTKHDHTLTILDTPGHAAFTAMRARGAKAVDIVVLVVAADDGPMPSTEEALAHARAAKVPVVVALTKIDKGDANVEKAKQKLTGLGLQPEEWGGETAMLGVSALKNQGVEELLERVFLESEVLDLSSHPKGPARGVVLEAEINEGKGIVAHLLVQDGTLNRGDVILAGEGYGKVRSMHDDRGRVVETAPPSMPVEVSGLSALPGVGEEFYVVESLAKAKEVAEERERKNRAMSLTERRQVTAESLMRAVAEQAKRTINLVVRADVQGSVEVLKGALSELKHAEVEVRVLFAGVGAVTENDVNLAATSNATVIAFHVATNDKARAAADRLNVEIRYYEIIYELLDQMRDRMEGTLAPELSEEVTGHVEVRALFKSSKVGNIAGCHVLDGSISRDSKVRLIRDGRVIHTGQIGTLRREKDDAKEVRAGFDCGLTLKDYQDVRQGDTLEAFKVVSLKRTLGSTTGGG